MFSSKDIYKLKQYIYLMRVKHWIKNVFILIPLVFSRKIFSVSYTLEIMKIFCLFSIASSMIYVINDMFDLEKDKRHPTKCNRPLASGKIKIKEAKILTIILFILFLIMGYFSNKYSLIIILSYILLNIFYSKKLKHIPIIDVMVIAIGFILRVISGSLSINTYMSKWLLLTIFSLSLFLGFGKRKNEITKLDKNDRRKVLEYYNTIILNNYVNIFVTMFLVFYSLYCFEEIIKYFYVTIPIVIYATLKYNLLLSNKENEGDPTEILLSDMGIKISCLIYSIITLILLYKLR